MPKINFPQTNLDVTGIVYFFIGIIFIVKAGFEINSFSLRYMEFPNEPQPYPFGLVIMLGVMMLVHIGILLLLAKSFKYHPWISVLLAFVVTFGFLFLVMLGSMHSPPVWSIFAIWEVVLLAFLIVFSIMGIFKKLTE